MIKIQEQAFISELGLRSNNEDKCGYLPESTYVVCDGVGGLDKGEIASDIVCSSILDVYAQDANCSIDWALPLAESRLASYLEANQNSQGMATTLTLAQVREDGVYVAWVGDSRIYQFRSGKIHYVTKDHSWVNEAVDLGLITLEESINHPKSNIITRAVQANKPVKADIKLITDILAEDYFLLCSDGVLESWDNSELEDLFFLGESPAAIVSKLKLKCEKLSKDNFTALVFKIQSAEIKSSVAEEDSFVEAIPIEMPGEITEPSLPFRQKLLNLLRVKIFGN
jgi:protein phosphatase